MVPFIYSWGPSLCWGRASLPGSELWAGRLVPEQATVPAALGQTSSQGRKDEACQVLVGPEMSGGQGVSIAQALGP